MNQSRHLFLRTSVSELQVIQHGVVLFRKPLICVLDRLHIRAHFVGVVGHIFQRAVGHFGSLSSVTAG